MGLDERLLDKIKDFVFLQSACVAIKPNIAIGMKVLNRNCERDNRCASVGKAGRGLDGFHKSCVPVLASSEW